MTDKKRELTRNELRKISGGVQSATDSDELDELEAASFDDTHGGGHRKTTRKKATKRKATRRK